MKKLFSLLITLLFISNFSYAQTTVQKFFSADWNSSYKSIQTLFPKIKFTEKIFPDVSEISFNKIKLMVPVQQVIKAEEILRQLEILH